VLGEDTLPKGGPATFTDGSPKQTPTPSHLPDHRRAGPQVHLLAKNIPGDAQRGAEPPLDRPRSGRA